MLFMHIVILGLLSHVSYSFSSSEINNNRIKIKAVLAANPTLISSDERLINFQDPQCRNVSCLLAVLRIHVAQNEPCFRIDEYRSDDERVRFDARMGNLRGILEVPGIDKTVIEPQINALENDNDTKELSKEFEKLNKYGKFLPLRFFVKRNEKNEKKFKDEGELLTELPVTANGKSFYFDLYLQSARGALSDLDVNSFEPEVKKNPQPEVKKSVVPSSPSPSFSPSLKAIIVGSLLVGTLGTTAYSLYQKYFGTMQSDKFITKATPGFFDTGYNALSATYNAVYNYFMGTNPEKLIKPGN